MYTSPLNTIPLLALKIITERTKFFKPRSYW